MSNISAMTDLVEISDSRSASMMMAVFWVVAPCSLVEVYRRFRSACCLHYQDDRPDDEGNKHR
jgi:hypothetical protein